MRFLTVALFLVPCFAAKLPNLPVYFEPNLGQAPRTVRFISPGLLISPAEVTFLSDGGVRMVLEGGNPDAVIEGAEPLPGVSNYFLGNNAKDWKPNVPHYGRILVKQVYPGIDLVYYGNGTKLEFDFIVAPGADPRVIRLRFPGAQPAIDAAGELVVRDGSDPIRLRKPDLYQQVAGVRKPVGGRFFLDGRKRVRFAVETYDKSIPLVIDPVLSYATLLAASVASGTGVSVDPAGNIYLAGNTTSAFLTINAFQSTLTGGRAAFVAKFNPAGTTLLYATFLAGGLGGNGNVPETIATSISADAAGSAYVVGYTNTTNFPVTPGTIQPLNRGLFDLFVTKLNATGSAVIYSTYLGGSEDEGDFVGIPSIAVDSTGSAYVAAGTTSVNLPVTPASFQPRFAGGVSDGFVAKLDPLGSRLMFCSYLGGPGDDVAHAVSFDLAGNAYIAGSTSSASFPNNGDSFQSRYGGGASDAYVVKMDPSGSRLIYSTFLGGSGADTAFGLTVDSSGNAFIVGGTSSINFPVSAAAFRREAAGIDGFVAKLNPAGNQLAYSTYLGGSLDDYASDVAVDSLGFASIVGYTRSKDFPVTADAFQSGLSLVRRGGGSTPGAAFLTRLSPDGTALAYSTYYGGSREEEATAVALDDAGNAYVTGSASSINVPRTTSTYEPSDRTDFETAFLAKFEYNSRNSMSLGSVISAASYQPASTGVIAPGQIVVLFGNELGPAQLTTLQLNSEGRVDTTLAGVRILFDGVAAPVLYVSAKQLSAVVPYSVAPNGHTTVQVEYQGQRSNPLRMWVAPAAVGIFTQNSSGLGPAAVLNQDGSVNSPSNPAEKGSVVVLFATGEGRTDPPGVDGQVIGATLPRPVLRIFAQVDGRFAEVLYAGSAPGLVAGVLQMNVKVPADARSGPAIPLSIGGMDGPFGVDPSERVTISIR